MQNKNPKKNASGCTDMTYYDVMVKMDEEERFKKLIGTIKYISKLAGFNIENRIVFRDDRSGRIWK